MEETSKLSTMERTILDVICRAYPADISKTQIRVHTGYASSGKLGEAFASLVKDGYAVMAGPNFLVAARELFDEGETGIAMKTGGDLRAALLDENISKLSLMERTVLGTLCNAYPDFMTKEAIRKVTGYASSGKLGEAFAALVKAGYAVKGDFTGQLAASGELFR